MTLFVNGLGNLFNRVENFAAKRVVVLALAHQIAQAFVQIEFQRKPALFSQKLGDLLL